MTVRPILIHPDARLRRTARPVAKFDDRLHALLTDLEDTMYGADGIGLAAPQLGINRRIVVMDCDRENNERRPLQLVNPEICHRSDQTELRAEGCLSIPEVYEEIKRSLEIEACYQDRNGKKIRTVFAGMEARCIAHEIDHLDGRLFIDYLGPLKQQMITNRLRKIKRTGKLPRPE